MEKKDIRLSFKHYQKHYEAFFKHILNFSKEFNIIIDDEKPEYVIFGEIILVDSENSIKNFKELFEKYKNAILIFYTEEAILPNFNLFDYIIGLDDIKFGDRYMRNSYILNNEMSKKLYYKRSHKEAKELLKQKKYFCNFIYSNGKANHTRNLIFETISKYKFVHSFGRYNKNCELTIGGMEDGWYTDLINAKSQFKFSIAAENTLYRGAFTEKILTSFFASTVPIYFGDDSLSEVYNKKSFISYHDFNSMEEFIKKIKEIDENDELWIEMMCEPFMSEEQYNNLFREKEKNIEMILDIFRRDIKHTVRRPNGFYIYLYKNLVNYNIEKNEKLESNVESLLNNSNSDTANILKYGILKESMDNMERKVSSMETKLYKKSERIEKILNQIVKSIIWWCPVKSMRDKLRTSFMVD